MAHALFSDVRGNAYNIENSVRLIEPVDNQQLCMLNDLSEYIETRSNGQCGYRCA